jgi:hypothetical protein
LETYVYELKDGKKDDKSKIFSKGEGSWLNHVKIDDKMFWELSDSYDTYSPPAEGTYFLQSDSIIREDLNLLLDRDIDNA